MRDGRIMLFLFIVAVLVFQESSGQFPPQIPGKWRNPNIQRYVERLCRFFQCPGGEGMCDLRPYPCFDPPCDAGPTCVPYPGSSMKPGSCPSPFNIWTRRVRCYTDIACNNLEVCCHGFFGSECRAPLELTN
ncbi:hypothetical protein KP79_PYT11315 [Mizuhopecten yessoensis]|uniref:WAP domain-containing protein n=2 Tax=Mizuhopecten yessoensis TaxID=6573 RepID=A0A210R402_MIZYE|nr:hypothetical protein KP79_PYT11315 [Mizuhopecten yessoensis]